MIDVGCGGGILLPSRWRVAVHCDRHRPFGKPASAVAKLHGIESGIAVDYRLRTAEDTAAQERGQLTPSPVWKCSNTSPIRPQPCACDDGQARWRCVLFHDQSQPEIVCFAIVGAEYVLNMLPRGTHEYVRFITPAELAGMAGTRIAAHRVSRHDLQSVHQTLRAQDDVSVNYLLHCKETGMTTAAHF